MIESNITITLVIFHLAEKSFNETLLNAAVDSGKQIPPLALLQFAMVPALRMQQGYCICRCNEAKKVPVFPERLRCSGSYFSQANKNPTISEQD